MTVWSRLSNIRLSILNIAVLQRCNNRLSGSVHYRGLATKKPAMVIDSGVPRAARLLLLIIPLTTFGLGTWQVFRLDWKVRLIEDLKKRTTAPAVPLASVIDKLNEMEYYRVIVHGKFDHSKEQYIGPRSAIKESHGNMPNESGMHVITPFHCQDPDMTILVNRGWVPKAKIDPSTRQEGQIEGETMITGVVRLSDKRRPFMPHNDPEKGQWFWRDNDALATLLGTNSVFVDADARTIVPGGPVGGQTRVTLRNEHLQYIFTWYTLSLFTMYLYLKFRKRPSPKLPPSIAAIHNATK